MVSHIQQVLFENSPEYQVETQTSELGPLAPSFEEAASSAASHPLEAATVE